MLRIRNKAWPRGGSLAIAAVAVAMGLSAAAAPPWRSSHHHHRRFAYNPFLYPLPQAPVQPAPLPRVEPRLYGPYPVAPPPPGGPYAPPVLLPQGMMLDIAPPGAAGPVLPSRLDRWHDIGDFLRACWSSPPVDGSAAAGGRVRQVTLRLGFDRTGNLLGKPRVTFADPPEGTAEQRAFTAAALAAVTRCSPVPFTPGLGSAIAGQPFTIRFTDRGAETRTGKESL